MLRLALLVLAAHWIVVVDAHNCSIQSIREDEIVKWQPANCYRGTWSIISTCFTTIFACTWGIQHLNVPAKLDSAKDKLRRKTKWMLITLLFPELILIHAVLEFNMAWSALISMADHEKPVHWPWWFRKPPFAWLPYCREYLKKTEETSETLRKQEGDVQDNVQKNVQKWTLYHCYFANMGGFLYKKNRRLFLLTAQKLAKSECRWPVIKGDDIKDRSKQDWLAKTFAAFQILQLIFSLITRYVQGLEFSQLETVTLSFAICGVLIYYVNIYKPQNIDQAERFDMDASLTSGVSPVPSGASPKTAPQLDDTELLSAETTYDTFWAILLNKENTATVPGFDWSPPRIPNDNMPLVKGDKVAHPALYLLALASGLFSALNAIAWNFQFPTRNEKLLWHIATAVSAASPIMFLLAIPLTQLTTSAGDPVVFVENCLRLLKDFSWYYSAADEPAVQQAILSLERILDDVVLRQGSLFNASYANIFQVRAGKYGLHVQARDFLLRSKMIYPPLDATSFDLYKNEEFVKNFLRLAQTLQGFTNKRLSDAARTNEWPRKPLLHPVINSLILYGTCILYGASRLIILAVAVSSMRKMPGSVYFETSWTPYFPKFGASG